MSSALRSVSQIESPIKFLYAVNEQGLGGVVYVPNDRMAAVIEAAEEVISSPTGINTIVKSTEPFFNLDITYTTLVRDMGRRVTVVHPTTGAHRQVWIQVQAVNNSGAEGVEDSPPDYNTFWVCTFNEKGSNIIPMCWVRIG